MSTRCERSTWLWRGQYESLWREAWRREPDTQLSPTERRLIDQKRREEATLSLRALMSDGPLIQDARERWIIYCAFYFPLTRESWFRCSVRGSAVPFTAALTPARSRTTSHTHAVESISPCQMKPSLKSHQSKCKRRSLSLIAVAPLCFHPRKRSVHSETQNSGAAATTTSELVSTSSAAAAKTLSPHDQRGWVEWASASSC